MNFVRNTVVLYILRAFLHELSSKCCKDCPSLSCPCYNLQLGHLIVLSLYQGNHNGRENKSRHPPSYMRWPHKLTGQVHGLSLREIGGGFTRHHRAPSVRAACYAIAKPSTMVQKMQNLKSVRGHRNAVYCGKSSLSDFLFLL